MSFIWPPMLVGLLALPLLAAGYTRLLQARARQAGDLGPLGQIRQRIGRRRHVPFAVFLAAAAVLVVGMARPEMALALPRQEGTVILAFDVSNSMIAEDLGPTRIDAAKEAGQAFVENQPSGIQIGVVAFSDGGLITLQPTHDRDPVLQAIDRLSPEGGTSLGNGLFTSLSAIAGEPIVLNPDSDSDSDLGSDPFADPASLLAGVDIGYHGSAVIVLLSDGEDTSGLPPGMAAELAATAGVRVFPIGVGSEEGAIIEVDGYTMATGLDEATMEDIAASTNGTYYRADSSEELTQIYSEIDLQLTLAAEITEVTGLVAGLGLLLLLVGAGLSMAWFGRVP